MPICVNVAEVSEATTAASGTEAGNIILKNIRDNGI